VVFGQGPGKIDLAALRSRGFRINGAARFDYAGSSVAGAGDLNGDGLEDLVISSEQSDRNSRADSGSAYAVFGRRAATTIELAKLGNRGLRLDGAAANDLTSWSVAGVGDMNGDKQPDLLVGAQAASSPGRENAGVAYVAFLPDLTVPVLKVTARFAQRVLRTGGVLVTASCNEACTLTASGAVGAPRGIPLPHVSVQVRSAGRRAIRLTLPPASRARLADLLSTADQVTATVTVRAVDKAGNATVTRNTITVVR
jgi:FG-GAP repeat